MKTSKPRLIWLAATAAAALGTGAFSGAVEAADLGPYTPPLVETWTGFSLGVGGGVMDLDADVTAKALRIDRPTVCPVIGVPPPNINITVSCPPQSELFRVGQSASSNLDDTGGFFTMQAAYDYQFAQRWVAGAFVDADLSNLSAESNLRSANTTVHASLRTNWSMTAGGRFGWLATPKTLLYFLAGYTHAELDNARLKVNVADPLQGHIWDFGLGIPIFTPGNPFDNRSTSLVVKLPDSFDGFSLGGGAETKLGNRLGLKLEYRWTHLNGGSGQVSDKSFQKGSRFLPCLDVVCLAGSRHINARASADLDDIDIQSVRAVLTYHFWSDGKR